MNNAQKLFEYKCRACMLENQNFYSLCDEAPDKPLTILEMLSTTIPQVPINSNDELSKKICGECLNTLIIVHKFQQMYIASDKFMRSLLISSTLSSDSNISKEQVVKHVERIQESTILDNPMVVQDPLKLPCSVKVEIVDNKTLNETALLEQTKEYQSNSEMDSEWSDDDDMPLRKSGKLKLNPLATEEFQNCLKFEPGAIEMQECDLRTSMVTTREKSEIVLLEYKDAMKDYGINTKLKYHYDSLLWSKKQRKITQFRQTLKQHSCHGEINTLTPLELSTANESSISSMKHETAIHRKSSTDQQEPSFSGVSKEIEIEKPNATRGRKYNHQCPNCDATFASNYKLEQHFNVHDVKSQFVCEICNYRYMTHNKLAKHMYIHETSPAGGYKCLKCPRRFEKSQSLISHMKTHRENLLKCEWCSKKFQKLITLSKHLRKHPESRQKFTNTDHQEQTLNIDNSDHQEQTLNIDNNSNGTMVYKIEKPNAQFNRKYHHHCEQCDTFFNSKYMLQRHASVHLETNPFVCEICNYRFIRVSGLALHIAVKHETEPPDGVKCPECPRLFEKRISLKRHMKSHRSINPEHLLFKCNLCPKKFQKFRTLSQHIKLHPENQKFKCSLCNVAFGKSSKLEDHLNQHKGLTAFACDHCNKEFTNKTKLIEHKRLHTGEKPYLCPKCGKSFRTSTALELHLKRHNGEKTVQCPECPKKFPCRSDQIKHMEIHRNIKPYSCNICGSCFTRAYSLRTHMKIHSGERPHKCDVCNMAFSNIHKLRIHHRKHTGDKPYKCKYCEKAFAINGDLNKHIRIHIGEKTYICDECPEAFKYQKELREHQAFHYRKKNIKTYDAKGYEAEHE